MARSKLVKANEKIAEKVVGGYKKIEEGVVGGYKMIEEGAVNGFTKISDSFVDEFLTKDGETVEEAKARLEAERKAARAGAPQRSLCFCRRGGRAAGGGSGRFLAVPRDFRECFVSFFTKAMISRKIT